MSVSDDFPLFIASLFLVRIFSFLQVVPRGFSMYLKSRVPTRQ
jgi:hypothetical protein